LELGGTMSTLWQNGANTAVQDLILKSINSINIISQNDLQVARNVRNMINLQSFNETSNFKTVFSQN